MELALSPQTTNEPLNWTRYISHAPVTVAIAAYLLLAFPLRSWLVDDAAISLAYAINWTRGEGLVSQPGMAPVEGYSNFLWVAALGLLSLIGAATVTGIKMLSFGFVAAALVSLNQTCKPLMSNVARLTVLLLAATCSSVVTWTSSGLENPMTLFLASEMLRATYERRAAYLGVLVATLGMTRPEGILFAAVPFMFLRGRDLLLNWAVTGALFSAFLAFRWWTFGDVVPNTFYAKEAGSLNPAGMLFNALDLTAAPFGSLLIFILVVAVAHFTRPKRVDVPLAMMAVTGAIFILMPPDWMPDRRFATAFMPAAFVFCGITLSQHRLALIALVVVSAGLNANRLRAFYADPTVPMAAVQAISDDFDRKAAALGLRDASVLMPDIGAALIASKLKVYDLAGLCDPLIAKNLRAQDKSRLHDYVFEELRPTFIRSHGPWARHAAFETDLRFARDYLALSDTEYVRRDVLKR